MIKKIDNQLETYDERVGSSLNTIQCNGQGQIAIEDLKTAMKVIKHRPDDQTIDAVVKKLDVDQDGYVVCCVTCIPGVTANLCLAGPRSRRRAHTGHGPRHCYRR